ncbi:MAG: ABC transporter permease [Myxococcota bacterium]
MRRRAGLELGLVALAVLLAFVVGGVLIALRGHSPLQVYGVWFSEALFSPGGRAQVVFKATTLVFTALAAAFAFEAGMFNIGAEGQIYLGAFLAAVVGHALPAELPGFIGVLVIGVVAAAGGGLGALIPAVLKAKRHTHEVITTMMMNFILLSVVNYLLGFVRESAEVVRTPLIPAAFRLAKLERGYDGSTAGLFAVLVAAAVWWFFRRTRAGYELRVLGQNPGAAEFGGIAMGSRTRWALISAGALAGLGGLNFVLGSPGYFEQHFAPFQGYLGIAVALLAKNHPLGILPAALLFATMSEGSQAIQEWVPPELGSILQAIMVVFVISAARLAEVWSLRRAAEVER